MKPLILAAVLVLSACTSVPKPELLGRTPQGFFMFKVGDVAMVCAPNGTTALCHVEDNTWLLCDYREPHEGYFANCRETEAPAQISITPGTIS